MVPSLAVFTTCPSSRGMPATSYGKAVRDVARWSDSAGCVGMLVYADNGLADPWLVAQIVVTATERLAPLVAVQPVYMHPYAVAKLVASVALLHGRRVDLNMVAGGFRNDLEALNDSTPHDRRYDRLREYTAIIAALLRGGPPVTMAGDFYRVTRLALLPELPPALFPTFFVAGSSEAGRATAHALGATSVEYPAPASDYAPAVATGPERRGIRVGIIARDDEDVAWEVARARFPDDRRGRIVHALAVKVSDSNWHHRLSEPDNPPPRPYWMEPFLSYQTFCPYLVGSYASVGDELRRYVDAGVQTFILDVPRDEDDLGHTALAFEHAVAALPR
jgi:alkanesulfonate monooxygenase